MPAEISQIPHAAPTKRVRPLGPLKDALVLVRVARRVAQLEPGDGGRGEEEKERPKSNEVVSREAFEDGGGGDNGDGGLVEPAAKVKSLERGEGRMVKEDGEALTVVLSHKEFSRES